MKKIFSLLFAVLVLTFVTNAQDAPHSVGPAPVQNLVQGPVTGDFDASIGKRYFSQISSSPTFQFGKAFTESCTITNVGAPFTITFPGGLMYRNGVVYTYNQSSPFQLWSIDTTTGTHTLVFNMTGVPQTNFTGMCWDGTNVYGLSTSITQSQIFTINMTTGACTPIGAASAVCAGGITLLGRTGAQYSLFALDIVADNLYKANKTTGVFTLVGPLGQNLNFGQDGSVDNSDFTFYAMDYAVGPELRKVDTTTGTLGPVLCSYTAQATGMAILPPGGSPGVQNYAMNLPTPGVNTNFVSIPHQSGMIGFTNLTIEAWVKPGGITTAATVLNKGAASFDYQLGISATTMIPFVRLQGVVATATAFTVTPLVWTHIAASFDGTNVRFYKDGALVSTVPLAGTPGSSANEMRIGRGNSDAGNGNIEELRLWTVARTQGAIDSNKCRKYPSQFNNSTGLRGLWHLDNNLVDSVSGFNGTANGTVTFDTVSFPIPGANCNLVAVEPIGNVIPQVYSLSQNYPNPFNPVTVIQFSIPKSGFVDMKVYDILGREVMTLVQDPYEIGTYQVTFDATALSSGVYFYTLKVNDFSETKKMLLVK